jgi:hypothetical protein
MDTLTDNIIGIDFMHKNKLHYDVQTRQVKIAGIEGDQIVAIKEQVLPALASMVVMARYKGKPEPNVHFIASIYPPKNPMLSGMPAIVTVDKNHNCKIVIDNCAPYDITIDKNDIIALMDRETEQLHPLEDYVISAILTDIDKIYHKYPNVNEYKQKYIDILYRHQKAISVNKNDLGLASNFKHDYSKMIIQFTANNLKYQRLIKILLNNPLRNG